MSDNSLHIKDSPIHGKGLFTSIPRKSGEVLGVALDKIADTSDPDQDYKQTEIGEHINHSDDPNVKVIQLADGNLGIAASEDIEANEEITADYNQFSELLNVTLSKRAKSRYLKKKKEESGNITYIYSPKHVEKRNKAKAKRVQQLSKSLSKVRRQVKGDLSATDPNERYTALAVALIDETYERIGNDESAKEMGHFGVTTWKVKHVKFNSGKATISYIGKSGVKQKKTVTNKASVRLLKELTKGKAKGDKLFVGEDYFITANKVNKYLRRFDITAKDIRGFHANDEMRSSLKKVRSKGGKLPEPGKERESKLKKEFKEALEETAKLVGHKASTLKNQYLVPGMFIAYTEKGTILKDLAKSAALNQEEFGFIKQCSKELNSPISYEEDDDLFIINADQSFRKLLSLISRSYRKNNLSSPLFDSIKLQCQPEQIHDIIDFSGFPLSVRASLLDKPSEWKSDMFWFLKEHKEPPKGYMPSMWVRPIKKTKDLMPETIIDEPHIPIKPEEADILDKILISLNKTSSTYLKLVKVYANYEDEPDKADSFYMNYMPLKVEWSGKLVTAIDLLQYFKKHFKETIFDDIIGRIREQQKGKESYKYDAVIPNLPPITKMPISSLEAKILDTYAAHLGWQIDLTEGDRDEAGSDYFLPLMVKTPTGKDVKMTKLLTKLKDKYPRFQDTFARIEKKYSLLPQQDWTLVISAEPGDILTMSTGKGWTSCVTEGRPNFSSLDHAVSSYDMVAYASDNKTGKWLARVWLRFDGKGWWTEAKVYGVNPELGTKLKTATHKYLKDNGIMGEIGKYYAAAKGWSDQEFGQIQPLHSAKENETLLAEAESVPKQLREDKASYKIVTKSQTTQEFSEVYWLKDLLKMLPDSQFIKAESGKYWNFFVFMPTEYVEIVKKHSATQSVTPYSTYDKIISFTVSWKKFLDDYPDFHAFPKEVQEKIIKHEKPAGITFVEDFKVREWRRDFNELLEQVTMNLNSVILSRYPSAQVRYEGERGEKFSVVISSQQSNAVVAILKEWRLFKYFDNFMVTDTIPRRASFLLSKRASTPQEEEITDLFRILGKFIIQSGGFKNMDRETKAKIKETIHHLKNKNPVYAEKLIWNLIQTLNPETPFPISKRATNQEEESSHLYQILNNFITQSGGYENMSQITQDEVENTLVALYDGDLSKVKKLLINLITSMKLNLLKASNLLSKQAATPEEEEITNLYRTLAKFISQTGYENIDPETKEKIEDIIESLEDKELSNAEKLTFDLLQNVPPNTSFEDMFQTSLEKTFQVSFPLSKRAEKHEGAMLAIMAPKTIIKKMNKSKMIDKDTTSSDGIHITLLYLGKAKELNKTTIDAIEKATEKVCAKHAPLKMRIAGAGLFTPGDDGTPVFVVPNAKGLSALQADLENAISNIIDLPSEHGWVPHMTVGYSCEDNPELPDLTEEFAWTANKVRFQVGGKKIADISLSAKKASFPLSKRASADPTKIFP